MSAAVDQRDTATRHARRRVRLSGPGHVRAVLAVIVGASFVVRALAGLVHVVPYYFADEYAYAALARGIARHGAPVVRGSRSSFPALLEPVSTAPVWLLVGGETAVHAIQSLHALEMSLGALPVYLIAARVGLSQRASLLCAALAVLSPELFWSSFLLADPLSYPLALTAVWAAVRALDDQSRGSQALFLLFALLAMLTRTQFVVLPLTYLAAATVTEQGSIRLALRRNRLLAGSGAAALGLTAVVAATGGLGPYSAWLLHPPVYPAAFATSALLDTATVALAAGFVLAPGAVLGLDLALSSPRGRAELGFGAFGLFTACSLIALASFNPHPRVMERYLIILAPLVPVLFLLWVERGAPHRWVAGVLAATLTVVAVVFQLPARAPTHSASLWGLDWLSTTAHADHAGYVAIPALGLAAALLSVWGGRWRTASLISIAVASMTTLSAGAFAFDRANAREVRNYELPAAPNWIDRSAVGTVALLQTPGASRGPSLQQLFWNERLDRVLSMHGAAELDFFAVSPIHIARDGQLLASANPISQELLVPRQGSPLRLADASLVRRTQLFELWRPRGPAHLAWIATGLGTSGEIERRATITVWTQRRLGVRQDLHLVFELLRQAASARSVTIRSGTLTQRATIDAGGRRLVVTHLEQRRSTVVVDASGNGLRLRTVRVIAGAVGRN